MWPTQHRVAFPAPPPRNCRVRFGGGGGGTGAHVVGQGTAEYGASADNGGAARGGRWDRDLLAFVFMDLAASEPSIESSSHRLVINAEL